MHEIDREGVPDLNLPTKYWVVHEGRQYPPKHVVALANRFANGEELDRSSFGGGAETNTFLQSFGF